MPLAPVATVENLKTACPLAGDHNLGVSVAKLDLSNGAAGRVNLPKNYGCTAHSASRRPAGAEIAAPSDLDGCRGRVEVEFEHRFLDNNGPPSGQVRIDQIRPSKTHLVLSWLSFLFRRSVLGHLLPNFSEDPLSGVIQPKIPRLCETCGDSQEPPG
jgi:hypothetical protein